MNLKRPISFLLALLLLPTITCFLSLNASAHIETDGKINLYEWEKYERNILFMGYEPSGSCYHSICVRYKYVEADGRIYIAVLAENGNSDITKTPEINETELYLSFDDSSVITVCSDKESEYDENEFYVLHGSHKDSFGGVAYEVEVVLKETKADEDLIMHLQMKDYDGNLTRIFDVEIVSEEMKEKESESVAESLKQSEKEAKEKEESRQYKSSKKTTVKKETTTKAVTAIITEEYVPYSNELKRSNREIVAIGAVCVLTSAAVMCVSIFKKDKK